MFSSWSSEHQLYLTYLDWLLSALAFTDELGHTSVLKILQNLKLFDKFFADIFLKMLFFIL